MMFNVENYISKLMQLSKDKFGSRLLYVGLQGSYLRNEAKENSDIDIMIIIDGLKKSDLEAYRSIIKNMDHFDKSCGFICSKEDLKNWNPLEICHLINSTKDYYGKLVDFVPKYSQCDIRNFVKININNLYHEICHRYIHSNNNKDIEQLSLSYKSTFFILQNLYYLNNNQFIKTKSELLSLLDGNNFEILNRSMQLNSGMEFDFDDSFELLFNWCQDTLKSL